MNRPAGEATQRPAVRAAADTTELRACELRQARRCAGGKELVCGAGGFTLGLVGRDGEAIRATCSACPIPAALRDHRACLHLRPIRIAEVGERATFFSCRWFYNLNPRRQPRSLDEMCTGCPYWFPRPAVEIMQGYWEETERIRTRVTRARNEPEAAPRSSSWSPVGDRRTRSVWQRLLEFLFWWV